MAAIWSEAAMMTSRYCARFSGAMSSFKPSA